MSVLFSENGSYKMSKRKQTYITHSKHPRTSDILNEPVAARIMEEMDVTPIEEIPYVDECTVETTILPAKKSLPMQEIYSDNRNNVFCTPTGSSSFKAFRDDFVMFRKLYPGCAEGEDPFEKLSDEIILHIFKWLPKMVLVKCSRVCKRWRNLSYDETLWRRYDFGKKLVKPGVLETLLSRGTSVLRLAMSEIKSPAFLADRELLERRKFPIFVGKRNVLAPNMSMCKLQYLDLSMATVSKENLARVLLVCNKLKKLSLENCILNDDCCSNIAQNTELVVLNMAMCQGLDRSLDGFMKICENCSKLKEWNLAWTDLEHVDMEYFLMVLPRSLKRLNISGHRNSLGVQGIVIMCGNCPYLTELDISDSPRLNDVALNYIINHCANLEHLHTSRSYKISPMCYRNLKQLKHLKKLEIFRTLTEEDLAELRSFLPDVKINTCIFSTVARPTTGIRRTSIWGLRVRD